jgi:dynein heavy chain
MFMAGAGGEDGTGEGDGYVTESKVKDLPPPLRICNVYAIHIDENSWESMYRCPVYVTSNRGPDYVFAANVRMDADDTDIRWILAGCALLLADD